MILNEFTYQAYEQDLSSRTLNGKQAIEYMRELGRNSSSPYFGRMLTLINGNTRFSIEARECMNTLICSNHHVEDLPYCLFGTKHCTNDTPILIYPTQAASWTIGNYYRLRANPVFNYKGEKEHFFITSIPIESLPKLDNYTIDYLAASVGNFELHLLKNPDKHPGLSTVHKYFKSIIHSNPEYEQIAADTMKIFNEDQSKSIERHIKNMKTYEQQADMSHQLYKDFTHDSNNYKGIRHKHTSPLGATNE